MDRISKHRNLISIMSISNIVKPTLAAVILESVSNDTSIVEIKYRVSSEINGVELHGVDAGLSWLKSESIELETADDAEFFNCHIEIKTSCEFRARGHSGDEDFWEEGKNHRIVRLPTGSIELQTSDEVFNAIEYIPDPPEKFSPTLKSIIVHSIGENSTNVAISYHSSSEIIGIELHGVEAGLSWLKDESISLEPDNNKDDTYSMTAYLEITGSCEIKARAFTATEDFWEEGKNHRIVRLPTGSINLQINEDMLENITFKSYPPVDYNPTIKITHQRLQEVITDKIQIFQLLVDISFWINSFIPNPLNDDKIGMLPLMIRNIKNKSREFKSYKLDLITLPITEALYTMYTSTREFLGDDVRLLIGEWEKQGYEKLFVALPEKVEDIENLELGTGDDAEKRKRELWKYN